jgi:hypothetical protein
VNSMSPAAKE